MTDRINPIDDDLEDDFCDHENYEANILEGTATCVSCGYRWVQSKSEIEREREAQVAFDEAIGDEA
jgi:C4-type Zn-finger protein